MCSHLCPIASPELDFPHCVPLTFFRLPGALAHLRSAQPQASARPCRPARYVFLERISGVRTIEVSEELLMCLDLCSVCSCSHSARSSPGESSERESEDDREDSREGEGGGGGVDA